MSVNVIVLTKSQANNFTHDTPWACISIGCEDGDWPKINKCQQVKLLQLAFVDANWQKDPKDILFNEAHANQIWDFVEEVWDKIDTLMVHCLAGQSRSPAVAAAIEKVKFNNDFKWFKTKSPNSLVYSTLLKVAHERGLIGDYTETQEP